MKKTINPNFVLANFHTNLELTKKKYYVKITSCNMNFIFIYNVFQNNSIDSEGKKFSYISQFGAFCSIVTADLSRISPTQCACVPPLPHTFSEYWKLFFCKLHSLYYSLCNSVLMIFDINVLLWELINGVRTAIFP